MKLFYAPGACSLSIHITLRETGSTFDLERVDTKTKQTASGGDFRDINPKGYVPALQLDDGQVLTENSAILQYLADRNPDAKLAPPNGTLERTRLQEYLNYVAAELHPLFKPFFIPGTSDETKETAKKNIVHRLKLLDAVLEKQPYLLGAQLSVADIYLFVIANWTHFTRTPLDSVPHVAAFLERVGSREKVQEALKAEGLT